MAKADPQMLFGEFEADGLHDADGNGLDAAFGRLDAALTRLERAATLKRPAAGDLDELKLEHAALRATVGDALEQLDAVLSDLQAPAGQGAD